MSHIHYLLSMEVMWKWWCKYFWLQVSNFHGSPQNMLNLPRDKNLSPALFSGASVSLLMLISPFWLLRLSAYCFLFWGSCKLSTSFCFKTHACMHVQSIQSYLTLCDPMDGSPPGSSGNGILQARNLEWIAMPSSGGSSRPRNRTHISFITDGIFTAESSGKPILKPFLYQRHKSQNTLRSPWGGGGIIMQKFLVFCWWSPLFFFPCV